MKSPPRHFLSLMDLSPQRVIRLSPPLILERKEADLIVDGLAALIERWHASGKRH